MQVAGLSNNSWLQRLQQDLLGLSQAGAASGQTLPLGGQGTTGPDATTTDGTTQASSPPPVFGGSLLSSFVLSALFGQQPQAPTPPSSTDGSIPDAGAPPAGGPGASLLSSKVLTALQDAQQQQPPTPPMPGGFLANQIIKADDTDGDGQLSLAEITTALTHANGTAPDATTVQSMFNQLDANGDGQISQSELAQGIHQMMQSHGLHHRHHGDGELMQPDVTTTVASNANTAAPASAIDGDTDDATTTTSTAS